MNNKAPVSQNDFVLDKKSGIYFHEKFNGIDYSDSSEDFLIDLFQSKVNLESYDVEMQKFIKDWPTRYHLSHMRTNLLESVKELFNPEWKVLELGAGMGALTLWLCDYFNSVDAIEGSLKRAQALRARAKNRQNLKIFVGDITDIDFKETYDLISLVGVLEYIPLYSQGNSRIMCIDLLKRLSLSLKTNGILLIGIENKLGAKYFSGCHEDHTGILFDGIMDYPRKSCVTFSRNEIMDILYEAGMSQVRFYHLFPDYKLPKLFFRETDGDDYYMLKGWVRSYFEDFSRERLYFFHDSLFVQTLIKSRLLHHFSNSFLIVSSLSEKVKLDTDFLIKKFWNNEDTKQNFHHTISLIQKNKSFQIVRKPLKGGVTEKIMGNIAYALSENEEYIEGEPLAIEIYKSLFLDDNFSSLSAILSEIKDSLLKCFSKNKIDNDGYEIVDGRSIDYCFWNLLRDENRNFLFIDKKWIYKGFLTADDVLFRNLNGLYNDIYFYKKQIPFSELIHLVLSRVYRNYDIKRFYKNIKVDLDFSNNINISAKTIEDYISRDIIKNVKIMPGEIINLQSKLSGRAWKLLENYYKFKDYFRKGVRGKS